MLSHRYLYIEKLLASTNLKEWEMESASWREENEHETAINDFCDEPHTPLC
jgi:hypothetical protein